ncbi:CheR family methyltransferase [Desulfobacter postgatei]|uniref:CheR family methyltransferase n=1 Tax=Desulfobacter postgatei TaxID=2293 RepID=UPI00259B0F1D|nr:CheR family methyltransferase [uncultured Desulfobacter sp.]
MLSDDEFKMILDYFNRPWKGYRKVRKGVKKRIRRHMQELNCRSARDYISIIAADKDQKSITESCLLVTISRFFRDRRMWEYLETTILPEFIKNVCDQIQVWSAGCACGEEAYSLSILWHKLTAYNNDTRLNILATDVNPVCIQRAQKGWFEKSSLKEMDPATIATYFKKIPGKAQYEVHSCTKPAISWQFHNLFTPMTKGPFHIIMLRNNLLTYHQGTKKEYAFQMILDRLIPGGYIMIGSNEKLPTAFTGIFQRSRECPLIYQYTI